MMADNEKLLRILETIAAHMTDVRATLECQVEVMRTISPAGGSRGVIDWMLRQPWQVAERFMPASLDVCKPMLLEMRG